MEKINEGGSEGPDAGIEAAGPGLPLLVPLKPEPGRQVAQLEDER